VQPKRTLLAIAAAVVIGFPTGWIITMLLTPTLWKLEPVLNMELAGHSGPSDWVFYVVWVLLISALFLIFKSAIFRKSKNEL
jgi:ABC-type antimicrobial peptide transport system permease subunit